MSIFSINYNIRLIFKNVTYLTSGLRATIQIRETIVDKYATVIVDTNSCSVPTKYVGLKTNILLEANDVNIFQPDKKNAVHPINYGKK